MKMKHEVLVVDLTKIGEVFKCHLFFFAGPALFSLSRFLTYHHITSAPGLPVAVMGNPR